MGGGVGAGWQFFAAGLGLGWLFQRGASPGKGWLAWQFHRRGQGLGGESKGFGSGRVGVLFFESWRVDLVTWFASCCFGVREGLAWRGKGSGGVQGLRFRGGGVGGRGVPFLSFLTRTKTKKNGVF